MKNNNVEITGNICGDIRLLREAGEVEGLKEKIEVIIIANDVYDKEGKPNSLRIYMFGPLAEDFRNNCANGDKVKVCGHLKRKTVKMRDCEGKPTGEVKYTTEIIGERYELIRSGSSGYFQEIKRKARSVDDDTDLVLQDTTAGVDYQQSDDSGPVVGVTSID